MAQIAALIGSDTKSVVLNLAALVFLYYATVWIYNLFFHPLAKFPGPILWRASRIPNIRAVWSARYPYAVQKLHTQYGDVVRVAPNELSFINPSAWDDIFSNVAGANPEAFKKAEIWHGNRGPGATSVFSAIDLKEHARIRRFMVPAFNDRAVLNQEPVIQEYADLCIQKLHERASAKGQTTVNIVDWLNFFLFDAIGDLSFGESFGCLDKCEYEDWMSQMNGAIKLHYLNLNLRYYPIITTLLKPLAPFLAPKDLIKAHMEYRERSTEKLQRRLNSTVNRPDIVSQLLRSEQPGEGLTPDEVLENCMLFINAASETTATVLTGVFNNLILNPESLSTLEKEVREFSTASDLTLQNLKQLPYLNAVIKEALRMCSSTPTGHMRITPPNGGTVAGYFVAGSTMVTVHPLALNYSPKYFYDPEAWHPERWLHDAETNPKSPYYNDVRKGVRAFGWGPQNCVGEPLGWAWMRLIIAKLLWTFDLKKADSPYSTIDWHKQEVFAILMKHRLEVVFAERTT